MRADTDDNAFRKMERTLRMNSTIKVKEPTLKEQLEKDDRTRNMTPEEKLSSMTWEDWTYRLLDTMKTSKEHSIPNKTISVLWTKYRKDLEEFHRNGSSFKLILSWAEEKNDEYNSWVK